jgi:adenosylhomocysteine nucleosidase
MGKIGIVTAMETEIWPLVRRWPVAIREHGGRKLKFFEKDEVVAVAGGIGHAAGQRAAEALIAFYGPDVIIATGLAGGLTSQWKAGRTMIAAEVIDEASGCRYATAAGEGTVVSSRTIAGAAKKRELAQRFAADVVDMEGAAVAEVALAHGARFLAVKAVSDERDYDLPPLQEFVDAEGRFQSARFSWHAAWHPRWWPMIVSLKLNTDRAARTLATTLEKVIEREATRTAQPVSR